MDISLGMPEEQRGNEVIMQSITIGSNQAGQRLDKFLHKYLPNAGTGFLYKMLRKKNITLNSKKAVGSEMLQEGDCVAVFFSQETFEKFAGRPASSEIQAKSPKGLLENRKYPGKISEEPDGNRGRQDGPGRKTSPGKQDPAGKRNSLSREYEKAYWQLKGIQILYEDNDFLFLNKPAGILSQKAKPEDCSLNEWMIGYLLEKDSKLAEELYMFRPSVCNRLDRNTSGIVLCGKSLAGLQFLSRYIRERSLGKFYHTICLGQLSEAARIQGYLCKDEKTNKVSVSGQGKTDRDDRGKSEQDKTFQERESGRRKAFPARKSRQEKTFQEQDSKQEISFRGQEFSRETAQDYIETAYVPLDFNRGYTYLEVELITGKPHQIRAHMASMGHPLIGDFKYGDEEDNRRMKREFGLQHQLLHACRIVFPKITSGVGTVLSGRSFTAPEPELFLTIKTSLEL